jgi:acyl carrier protein
MRETRELSELDFLNFTSKEFQVEHSVLSSQTEYRNLPNWSSLHALLFISAINDAYGVLISSNELSKSKTLGDLFDMIQNPN